MIRYGELHKALKMYTHEDIHEQIPVGCYRRVIRTCLRAHNTGLYWDVQQAASILLHLAFNEGHLQPSQLNTEGLETLDRAEKFLDQIRLSNHHEVIASLHHP